MSHLPFTQEQLEWIEEATRRGVSKGVRNYRNGAVAGFLILLVGVLFALHTSNTQNDKSQHAIARQNQAQQQSIIRSGNVIAVDGCNRDYSDRVKFRSLLLRLKDAAEISYQRGTTNKAQHDAAVSFYDDQLSNYPLLDCRQAAHILTNNPEKSQPTIDPFWVGNPDAPRVPRDLVTQK